MCGELLDIKHGRAGPPNKRGGYKETMSAILSHEQQQKISNRILGPIYGEHPDIISVSEAVVRAQAQHLMNELAGKMVPSYRREWVDDDFVAVDYYEIKQADFQAIRDEVMR